MRKIGVKIQAFYDIMYVHLYGIFLRYQSASTAVYSHLDDSPYTIYHTSEHRL